MRIPADFPYLIDYEPDRWRLMSEATAPESAVFEAGFGGTIQLENGFAAERRVGPLTPEAVERVVAGWSPADGAWHLGLLLTGPLAAERGSRWLELAAWNDPAAEPRRGDVVQAGEGLAALIGRPFALVPPKVQPSPLPPAPAYAPPPPAPVYAPAPPAYAAPVPPPARTLPAEPLTIGGWRFEPNPAARRVVWHRTAGGGAQRIARGLWYLLWAAVTFVLSYQSLSVAIFPTTPEFLPVLGLFSALLLLVLGIGTLVRTFTRPNALAIDGAARTASLMRGERVVKRYDLSDADALYVTETVGKANPRKGVRPLAEAEFTAALADGRFRPLLRLPNLDERVPLAAFDEGEGINRDAVFALGAAEAVTPLQRAAVHTAAALGVRAVADRRVK